MDKHPPHVDGHDSEPSASLYDSPGEALKKVSDEYGYWTGRLTEASTEMCYAVIGANWVVFGSVNGILKSSWAKGSLLLVLLALASSILTAWWLGELLRKRVEYGETNTARWREEFRLNTNIRSPWPFTRRMETIGKTMRILKAVFSVAAGALVIIGAIVN